MIKIAISGANGRMGQAISRLALLDPDIDVSVLLERPGYPQGSGSVGDVPISTELSVLKTCDVLIDFTLPEGTMRHLEACLEYRIPMVIGTTGLDEEQIQKIKAATSYIPIVYSTNMSVGVNVLFKLIELTGKKMGDCAMTISETHHAHKKDAPSGTAKTMAEIAESASGRAVDDIRSCREREVIGDHEIIFETSEDILVLSHHAKNRDMFAKGALRAAKFLRDKSVGLFHMQDVLNLSRIQL
jgi:4-hydroxy-tetrahydrodipicolinate reductase